MNGSHDNSCNLITLVVSPNSTCDKNGTVKLSHVKATKVSKICEDIESLISNSKPYHKSCCHNIYRKTGSSEIMTDLLRLGHEFSYTETKFIEDKWAEWSKKQSKLVPSNFREGVRVTHVVDNIDCRETHKTNSIIVRQEYVT